MPLLGGLIKALFVGLIGIFAQWVTKRLAIAAAVAVVFAAITATMVGTMEALSSSAILPMPSWLSRAACWFLPSNLKTCVTIMVGAQATRWAYDVHLKAYQLKWQF